MTILGKGQAATKASYVTTFNVTAQNGCESRDFDLGDIIKLFMYDNSGKFPFGIVDNGMKEIIEFVLGCDTVIAGQSTDSTATAAEENNSYECCHLIVKQLQDFLRVKYGGFQGMLLEHRDELIGDSGEAFDALVERVGDTYFAYDSEGNHHFPSYVRRVGSAAATLTPCHG